MSKADINYVLNVSRVAEHKADQTFIEQGEPGVGFNLILEGEARVVHDGRTVAHLGPGDYFGEISLIDGGPRTTTVIAETPMTTLGITS
ncbi:MAG: cyclic nucleotide-binding domain-containing protein [Actinomycetota bacterium]|nr:cyclic nucleotide-binding domain-containing protein [Actinomycetota bacterium]